MGSITRVDFSKVKDFSSQLSKSSQSLRDILATTQQTVAKVGTRDSYSGAGAEQFTTNFNALSKKFHIFYDAVQNYAKFLNTASDAYQQADKDVARLADSLLNK